MARKDIYSNDNREGVEDLQANILSLDKTFTIYMMLSSGGPEDGFEFDLDPIGKEISGGRYVYKNWSDGAKEELTERELAMVLDAYQLDYETLML